MYGVQRTDEYLEEVGRVATAADIFSTTLSKHYKLSETGKWGLQQVWFLLGTIPASLREHQR